MLGSLILYLKGMRILLFQLSVFYHRVWGLLSHLSGPALAILFSSTEAPLLGSTGLRSNLLALDRP